MYFTTLYQLLRMRHTVIANTKRLKRCTYNSVNNVRVAGTQSKSELGTPKSEPVELPRK
jgi:hypothetical protein